MMLPRVVLVFCCTALVGCCDEARVPKELKQLYSGHAKDRSEAALQLGRCGSPLADRAVPRLSELIYDPNVGVQSAAAYALRKIDTPAARSVLERARKKRS